MPELKAVSTGLEAEPARKGGAHKRVQWRRPSGGKRRPGVIDATRAELVRGLEQRRGSLWFRVRRVVIVAGYPIAQALGRVRSLRADGAESLLAMTVALLYLADVRTGFIGKPSKTGNGRWQRYTLADMAQLAYGSQGEAELRRARRALDMMVSIGWAFPTKQVRRYAGDDTWRSEAAVRRLNFSRLCDMTGTAWLLSRDRQHADKIRGTGTASLQEARKSRERHQEARSGRPQATGTRSTPPATGDPPERTGSALQIAAILDLFGTGR